MAKTKKKTNANKKLKLTTRQALFLDYLIKGLTQEKAYIKAGYAPKTARTCSSQLLTKPHIIKELAIRRSRAAELADVTSANIMKGLAQIAFFDIRKIYHKDGTLKKVHELDDDTSAALIGLNISTNTLTKEITRKIKMSDKFKALDSLAKIEGLYEKDNKQKTGSLAEAITNLLDEIDGTSARMGLD